MLTGSRSFGVNVFSINCSLLVHRVRLSRVQKHCSYMSRVIAQNLADRTLNVPEGQKIIINVRCGSASKEVVWGSVQDALPVAKHQVCTNLLIFTVT